VRAVKAPILARITVNGEMTHFSTKFHILPDRWNGIEGRAIGGLREEQEINAMLDDYRALVKARYNEIVLLGDTVTVSKVKQAVLGLDHHSKKLLDICDKFIVEYGQLRDTGAVTQCTYQRYVLTRDRLAEYMKRQRKIDDILLSEINNDFIKGFDLWNRTQHAAANNTAVHFVKHFRTMFNIGLNNGWVRTDPFATYKIKMERVDRGYLTDEELATVMNKQLVSKRLDLVRDVFIFSCFTGLAYIDTKELTTDNLQMRDGNMWIITKRHKTDINANIRLLDVPLRIIEKYKGQAKKNRVLPVMSNQKVNDYLKETATL